MNSLKQVLRHLPRWPGRSMDWNESYKNGRWMYLRGLPELGHYSIIAGYLGTVAPRGSVLDIGCGEGLLCRLLPAAPALEYTGIDLSSRAIDAARAEFSAAGRSFVCADFCHYQPERSWDAIVFNESLYYAPEPRLVLTRYARYLKPNGVFVISMYLPRRARAWQAVGEVCRTLDEVSVRHANGTTWICRLAQPSLES
ncbi:MAG TPA: class I SAM-dependent methyltransferase [Acidiferrobacteraceae bacterium]|nr:class I SAM-dependent methyltransferase [Acidiferrobacteraceae bacterium]